MTKQSACVHGSAQDWVYIVLRASFLELGSWKSPKTMIVIFLAKSYEETISKKNNKFVLDKIFIGVKIKTFCRSSAYVVSLRCTTKGAGSFPWFLPVWKQIRQQNETGRQHVGQVGKTTQWSEQQPKTLCVFCADSIWPNNHKRTMRAAWAPWELPNVQCCWDGFEWGERPQKKVLGRFPPQYVKLCNWQGLAGFRGEVGPLLGTVSAAESPQLSLVTNGSTLALLQALRPDRALRRITLHSLIDPNNRKSASNSPNSASVISEKPQEKRQCSSQIR